MYYSTMHSTPLGNVKLASDGDNLIGLWFEGQKYYGGTVKGEITENDSLPVFAIVKDWLDRYFSNQKPLVSELPLAPIGSEFRKAVWNILCEVPYGEYTTYGEIAKTIMTRMNKTTNYSQAVGGAVGHNPISIIIPCHRVVGSSGNLTGYAGGIEKKIKLLTLEGADMSKLIIPKE